jgi:hypothetical protein
MEQITIKAEEIVETNFGEKVLLDSPYEAKQFIKFMPWGEDDDVNFEELEEDTHTPDFEFSSNFSCHASWNADRTAWEIDVGSFEEASRFFESVGIDVDDEAGVLISA